MPDKSANGMFEYAKKQGLAWGTIDTMPDVPGLAVRYDGHVGYYVGNGEVVEERGFNYGCVKTKLKDRKWLHWYQFPCINYVDGINGNLISTEVKLGDRSLKKGSTGADVKELQNLLLGLGFTLPKYGADGDYGSETESAVKAFQAKYNITIDGIYGSQTHTAMMAAIADRTPDPEPEVPAAEPVVEPTPTVKVLTTTANVNVRMGDSTTYSIITTLSKGATIEPILDAQANPIISANNWYAVKCANQIGWVSGKYIK